MTVKLVGSSSGSVSLQAPATTSGGANRVLTLPDINSTVDTTGRAGNILQVVQTVKTDTASTNSTSEADVMTLNITPSSNSNKILLFVDLKLGASSNTPDPIIRLYRDSTQIYMGDADGNRSRSMFGADEYDSYNNAEWLLKSVQGNYLDSPSTASQITYKVKWKIVNNGTLYLNRTGADNNAANYPRTASSLVAMEVAA